MENNAPRAGQAYSPPQINSVGHLADLTQVDPPGKEVGGADGDTFLGLDLGSV